MVDDVDRPAFEHRDDVRAAQRQWGDHTEDLTVMTHGGCYDAQTVALANGDEPARALAQPQRTAERGVHDWLQIGGRGGDDAQDLGGGGLLLQRFGDLAVALLKL